MVREADIELPGHVRSMYYRCVSCSNPLHACRFISPDRIGTAVLLTLHSSLPGRHVRLQMHIVHVSACVKLQAVTRVHAWNTLGVAFA